MLRFFLIALGLFILFPGFLWGLDQKAVPLRELEKAALRYAGISPEEIASWKKRARWAAVLPKVLVGYDQKAATQINNTIQDSISVTSSRVVVGPPESQLDQNNDFNRGFQVRATWSLDELIFNNNSLSISAEARYRSITRSQILDELHQAYFERKRILLKYAAFEEVPPVVQLKLEELEAKLDTLTGGLFSRLAKGEEN